MNNNNTCPPPPPPASCPTTSGCNLCPYSLPSQTSVCGAGSAGGGDLPNGPLDVPCPKDTYVGKNKMISFYLLRNK